ILAGSAPALTLSSINEFRPRNDVVASALELLYAKSSDSLFRSGGENLFAALRELREVESKIPGNDESYPAGRFAASLAQISRLIKAGVGLEVAFTEIDGWDTHANQGGAVGQMANRLKELAEGLAAFYRDLGDRIEDVVVLTMSEFGRTVRENGNRGTDHGHANVMFVLGGSVRGGKVYGRWPGLAPEVLYDGRDLDLTTDFRAVCGEVITRHLDCKDVTKIFPNFRVPAPLGFIA
ncbi:MAG: DUF1501 domain-containing protein, partial [Deltaproteobacteria bacterium]|nr:DUF1501 domain-containing protein [Deltaproteobacteria bacterium]